MLVVRVYAFDSSPLSYFARANKLGILEALTTGADRVVVGSVYEELMAGVRKHPQLAVVATLPWLRRVTLRGQLRELAVFAEYSRFTRACLKEKSTGPTDEGAGRATNVGETETLAWAEVNGAVAIVDERAGRLAAESRDVEVHGTLWSIARGYSRGALDRRGVEDLVDQLRAAEAWFPRNCTGATFFDWANSVGLLTNLSKYCSEGEGERK